ncbi:MAG: ZIP family metal transporter [Balneolaceae bacterium]|nr:ZIP family metal transporter [Balneolaceae bacterium]
MLDFIELKDWFLSLGAVYQSLLGGLFTWGLTAAGAALVFFFRNIQQKVLDAMLGFAAGVMIAASFWSLLSPSIEMASAQGSIAWLPAVIGFLAGGVFLRICDAYIPHLHIGFPMDEAEGVTTSWRRAILLVLAITIHNIPEGLAIGVLFGAAASGIEAAGGATVGAAIALALGIGIQNFPEGTAVSVPLRREGVSVGRSFWYGQLSGVVEPISCVIGAAAVLMVRPILPYALAFAAGAMIYVVVEELIPESQLSGNTDIATMGTMVGFSIMMLLDVALG